MEDAHDILITSATAAEALARLHALKKAKQPKWSLAALAKKSGIASRGYLSDMLRGRRLVHPSHAAGLAAAFGLGPLAGRHFAVMVERDRTPEGNAREALGLELARLGKALAMERPTLPRSAAEKFFAFEVLCALGLAGENGASTAQVLRHFPGRSGTDVDEALRLLTSWEFVTQDEGGRYRPRKGFVLFQDSEDGLSHLDFLRQSLRHAEESLPRWFGRPEEALIHSSIITVRRADYRAALAALRLTLEQFQSSVETDEADGLIRFNVQVYPG